MKPHTIKIQINEDSNSPINNTSTNELKE
jgi:hypothetical protein